MGKTGIVMEGGGQKCIYTAGVLDAMLDDGICFDYGVGVSAASGCLASFAAGQRRRNYRFFAELSNDPRYLNLKNFFLGKDVFNLHWIYGEVTGEGGRDPLDWQAFRDSAMDFCAPATDAMTGQAVYFRKTDVPRNDYRAFMASCAIPVACHPVEIGGALYYDGGVADPLPVEHALAEGCDKIVAVLVHPRGYQKPPQGKRWLYRSTLRRYPAMVRGIDSRHLRHRASVAQAEALERSGKALIIAPSREIKIGTYTKDKAVLDALYQLGYDDWRRAEKRWQNLCAQTK